jgi:superfamily II DNA or RNA helicase
MNAVPPAPVALPEDLTPLQRDVLQALAVLTGHRPPTVIHKFLQACGWLTDKGRPPAGDAVRRAVDELAAQGRLASHPHRSGYWAVPLELHTAVYLSALERDPRDRLAGALAEVDGLGEGSGRARIAPFVNMDAACAAVRLALLGGAPPDQLEPLRRRCGWGLEWQAVLERALFDRLDTTLLMRLHPLMRMEALQSCLELRLRRWSAPDRLPLRELVDALLNEAGRDPALRALLAGHTLSGIIEEWRLLGGLPDEPPLPAPDTAPDAAADPRALLKAGHAGLRLTAHGRWAEASSRYASALEGLRRLSGQRKALLPTWVALGHVLALMALGTPASLAQAQKFCLTESGRRQASPDSLWGVLALAIRMRQGEERRDLRALPLRSQPGQVHPDDLASWIGRAWLHDPASDPAPPPAERTIALEMIARLHQCGLTLLAGLMESALAVLEGRPPGRPFITGASPHLPAWQRTLDALARLGQDSAAAPEEAGPATRLVWVLSVNPHGALEAIQPMEQRQGPRGWGKPRALPLSRLLRDDRLPAHDLRLVRCLRASAHERGGQRLDLAQAIAALVGHPQIEFDDAPGMNVSLTEAPAEIDVTDLGERLRVTLRPPPRWCDPQADRSEPQLPIVNAADQREADQLLLTTVLRDGPDRARVVRFSAAQKRAAQLIATGLEVPHGAMAQLDEALRGLGAHFRIHSDSAGAGTAGADGAAPAQEVEAETRLRAELTPESDGLALRLAVAPLGTEGPRLEPGQGRVRLIATSSGGTPRATRRDLARERDHLERVLEACPMLEPLPDGAPARWSVAEPELALALLERLPTLQAIEALDWPRGRPIQVDAAGLQQLKVRVRSGQDWLALDGGVEIDEQLVFSLGRLLDWSRTQRSRFVPMGDGRYLALTEELRGRLEDMAGVAEIRQDAARLTPLAAPWLEQTLEGSRLETDARFRERVERLAQLERQVPRLPGTLQAELRPYQQEGFEWAMRRAGAGFGAILADDMGLGKTLQALAVLLARGRGGAALVVAPTSLIGNWLAEARRFAPTLHLIDFGATPPAEREALRAAAGPNEVLLVSYTLLQLDAEGFAGRDWHTLVLDEAQAVKNAAARRSQAVHALRADFRLALSGTPIENRLAELWSIMQICNPGLLGTQAQFAERFAVPIERDRHRGRQRTLRRLVGPFILRRTKSQVLEDLPPLTERVLTVEAEPAEQAHYEALRRQALKEAEAALQGDAGSGSAQLHLLAQLTRLRRAACDPRLVTPELSLAGAKVRAFGELARELAANGHRTLVFSQFVDFLQLLRATLDEAGLSHQYLDGATPAAERSRRVAAFQDGEGDFFLISLKAGGFGLNLTAADDVVIADPWWNPAAEDQASGRAHRIGQQRPVTVYRLVRQGTLEERIVALHHDKRELAAQVLDGGDGPALAPLAPQELLALMRGDDPT